jgi:hypothetical protein
VAIWNVRVEARWSESGVAVLVLVLCLCFVCVCILFVSCCPVLLRVWGCRRRVAVGGVGDGETGSVSLYNVGNLNKLVSFFAPPHHAPQPRIGESHFHRHWSRLVV